MHKCLIELFSDIQVWARILIPCVTQELWFLFPLCVQGVLADYVSSTAPMIPALVVHCINEIEKRGLHEVRVSLHSLTGTDTHSIL